MTNQWDEFTKSVAEAVPRQPGRQALESLEEPEARDGLVRSPQLEEEQFALHERTERAAAVWLPEVDLVDPRTGPQVEVPVRIGECQVSSHADHLS